MMQVLSRWRVAVVLLVALSAAGFAHSSDPITEAVQNKTALPGYRPLYWDDSAGRLWMVVDKWESEFLFVNSLSAGVGSNDIGLDRGQLGAHRIVFFRRVGPKVLL